MKRFTLKLLFDACSQPLLLTLSTSQLKALLCSRSPTSSVSDPDTYGSVLYGRIHFRQYGSGFGQGRRVRRPPPPQGERRLPLQGVIGWSFLQILLKVYFCYISDYIVNIVYVKKHCKTFNRENKIHRVKITSDPYL